MKDKYYQRTVDGKLTNKPPAGYCTYRWHRGAITRNMLEQRGCYQKRCKYFRKNRYCSLWDKEKRK